MMNRLSLFHAIVVVMSLQVGCTSISPENLIPPVSPAETPLVEKTIKVQTVTGAKEEIFGGPELISNEEYTEALVTTLRKSQLFKTVTTNQPGDYELVTSILAHGQGDGLDYRSAMIVEYRIRDARTLKSVWKKAFNSRHEVTVFQAFSGAARTTKAQEGSVKKNLQQFITSLASAKF